MGVGLTYSMLGSWGFSKSRSTLSVVVTGIWNNFAKLGMPIVALAILAVAGRARRGSPGRRGGRPGRAGRRHRGVRAHPAERGLRPPVRARRRPLDVGTAPAGAQGPGRGVGPGAHEVPRPGHRAGAPALGCADRRHHRGPPVAVRRPAHHAAGHGRVRRRGRLGAGAGSVRLRPPAHGHPAHPRWRRHHRAGAHLRDHPRRRRGRCGGGVGADLPPAHLRACPIIFGAITYVYWRRNRSWLDSAPPLPASIAPVPGSEPAPALP